MRDSGRVSLVMGVVVMGTLFLVACSGNQVLPTTTVPAGATAKPATTSVPTATTITPSPGPPATAVFPATLQPSPTPIATILIAPSPAPTATVIAQQALTLTALHMITQDQGWATGLAAKSVAAGGVLPAVGDALQTTTGGSTWQKVSPPGVSPDSTIATFFLDVSNAWVAAGQPVTSTGGVVSTTITTYGTIDGGQTWQVGRPFTVSGGGPVTMSFVDTLHGWIMIGLYAAGSSEAVEILKTADGGVNWQPVTVVGAGSTGQSTANSLPYACDKTGITFANATTGWTTGACAGGPLFLYLTHDGGQTWQAQTPPTPPGDPAGLFSDCQCAVDPPLFTSAQNGVLAITVSQVNEGSYLYVTRDGGFTWALRELPVAQLVGLPDFFDADHGLVTNGAQIFGTSDGGQTWTQVGTLPISATNLIAGIDFVDPNYGWVTDGQHLYATHDASQTWITITPVLVPSSPAHSMPMDITLANDGQTLNLQVDQQFVLDLGGQYTWTVGVDNPSVVGRVAGAPPVKGAQGLYEALRPGTATLTATGEPICRQAQPPCAAPTRQFQMDIIVQ